jgi:hypothetical protein
MDHLEVAASLTKVNGQSYSEEGVVAIDKKYYIDALVNEFPEELDESKG